MNKRSHICLTALTGILIAAIGANAGLTTAISSPDDRVSAQERASTGPSLPEPNPKASDEEKAIRDAMAQLTTSQEQLTRAAQALQQALKGTQSSAALANAMIDGKLEVPLKGCDAPMRFIFVPAGNCAIGLSDADHGRLAKATNNVLFGDNAMPLVRIRVTEGFFILDRELMACHFAAFHRAKKGQSGKGPGREAQPKSEQSYDPATEKLKERLPIRDVSWRDAIEFCKWVQEQTGYVVRLPTEIEWEYAARGPWTQQFPWPGTEFYAWAAASGAKEPRELDIGSNRDISWRGVHDLGGNVSEWCADYYIENRYRALDAVHLHSPSDPKIPEPPAGQTDPSRVYRGGSYKDRPENCEVSVRRELNESGKSPAIGFRPVIIVKRRAP